MLCLICASILFNENEVLTNIDGEVLLMKNIQKGMALVLAVLLFVTTIPFSVFATETTASVTFAGGDGSIDNPYQVSTPEQLNAVRNDLSACYVQINDIDMADWGNWQPIGIGDSLYSVTPPANPPRADYQPFTGSYDGGGYFINNLSINDSAISYVNDCYGLFSSVDGGIIKNVNLINIDLVIDKSSTDYAQIKEDYRAGYAVYVGGVVGEAENSTIDNCSVKGKINVKQSEFTFVGGVSGNGMATNCVSTVDIVVNSVTEVWCGGIIGKTKTVNSTISGCTNNGDIHVSTDGKVYVGGISGEYGLVTDCVNFGTVEGKVIKPSSGHSSFAGVCNVGGIVGATSSDYVKNSINYGNISAYLDCNEMSNYVNTYSKAYAGGIAGYCGYYGSGLINQCYNISQSVSCIKISNSGEVLVNDAGRISGHSIKNNNCYSIAETLVNNSRITSTLNTSDHGQDLSKDDLLNEQTYIDFDFKNIWRIDENIGGAILNTNSIIISPDKPINPYNSFNQLYFNDSIVVLDVGESKTLTVNSHDVANVNGELIYFNEKIVDNTEFNWHPEDYEDKGIIKMSDDGQITALSEGYEYVLINSKDDINSSAFCHVFVGEPNEMNYTSTYDSKQYYAEGGFYSEVSSISDCIEIYLLFENMLAKELENLAGIDDAISNDTEKIHFKDIGSIKLTATVNGDDLSFDRNSYQNTYTTILDEISIGEAVDDILMLFPYNLNVSAYGNSYTVKVTLESESFETITEEYSFIVEDYEKKGSVDHINFVSFSKEYKVSKSNIYGETMIPLKNDAEYIWSKYLTFDFENYYKVVFADIMIELINISQLGNVSLVPVVNEWIGNYKTILSEVSTIVEDDYTGYLDVTENAIDKVLKKSKYSTEGMDVQDEIRDLVVLKLREKVSIDKINSAFAAVDKTQQYFTFFNLSVDITNDISDFIDGVSILNAYKEMDDEFKAVITNLYNQIPESDKKIKEAVYHYVNADSNFGYSQEILNEVRNMAGDITLDVFNTVYKKQVFSSLCNAIGNIPLKSGALFSSTAAFSRISTAIGSITTGVQLGLCISDIICDNSGKSEEMSKVVAMSEFSPYVINTLDYYESKLYSDINSVAVTEFEYAFALHKATQSYIMHHTVKSLETKRDSLIIKLFNRDDYDGVISDILAHKNAIDNLECHNTNPTTIVSETKVIAIKCPVNVFIYSENGSEIVRIVNDNKEYVADGISVFVEDGEKYIALPTYQKYSIKITATDSGTMEYIVTEYGAGAQRLRTVKKEEIPLEKNRQFTGQIVESMGVDEKSYDLVYDDTNVVSTELGDVDANDSINATDALAVLKHAAKISNLNDMQLLVADTSRDGNINASDALLILKYAAKLIDSF